MKEKLREFNKRLRNVVNFENLGFQDYESDDFFYAWKLKRTNKHKTDVINYGFFKDKRNEELFLNPISSYIVFEQVNKILINFNTTRFHFYLYEPTLFEIPNFDKNNDELYNTLTNLQFVINRVSYDFIFNEAIVLFQKQLEKTVLPFFDKIQTLQQVNDEILEKYDWKEWHKYISGLHGGHYFKSIVIMKLCNNEKGYKEFTEMYSQLVLDAINNGRTEVQDLYNTLMKLLDYLESGKYLEVV